MKVAIMLACFNRKEITKRCLIGLKKQFGYHMDKKIDIYVYDDHSTDGTLQMLKDEFLDVTVIEGSGQEYWCESMYRLMIKVIEKDYDYYLMVNDDVDFYENSIDIMFKSYYLANKRCAIVGSTIGRTSGKITYGGRNEEEILLEPQRFLQQCKWANWNCFLLDRETIKEVGIIDGKYKHSWGDFDYSYRMNRFGIPIFVATEYIGICEKNSVQNTFRDKRLSKKERLIKLFSPKGLHFMSYLRYNLKIKGVKGLGISIYGYISLITYIILGKEIK